jgi:methyltransferase FkbM-like protein
VVTALNIDAVAIIKIDTEGGELEVLRGVAATIARCRPFIVCEILPVGDATSPAGRARLSRQEAVQALLQTTNYRIFRLFSNASIAEVHDIGVHGSRSQQLCAHAGGTVGSRRANVQRRAMTREHSHCGTAGLRFLPRILQS